MKLALRSALVLVLMALGALLWMRGKPDGGAVRPHDQGDSHATPKAQGPAASSEPAERDFAPSPREEVASAPVIPGVQADQTLVRVRVVTQESGAPLANVRVRIESESASWVAGHFAVDIGGHRGALGANPTTDTHGRAEFVVEPGTDYTVRALADNGAVDTHQVPALARSQVREVTLHLPIARDILFFGRVIDDASGAPITTARAGFDWDMNTQDASRAGQTVDADGLFTMRWNAGMVRRAICAAEGYPRVSFYMSADHETRERALELRLARFATVDVLVRDVQHGIEKTDLRLTAAPAAERLATGSNDVDLADGAICIATTDAQGRARISNVPSKVPLTVTVHAPGDIFRNEPKLLLLEPGETRSIEIVVGSGGVVRGHVVDRAGQPIAWEVWLLPSLSRGPRPLMYFEEPSKSAPPHDDGTFRFVDVPIGVWDVGVAPPDVRSRSLRDPAERAKHLADFSGLTQTIEIRDGSESLDNVALVVDRGLFLRGTVADSSGAPPPANSFVCASYDGDMWIANKDCDASGRFEFGPLPAGVWTLRAWGVNTPDAPSKEVVAAAGTGDIAIRLEAGGTIRGTIIDRGSAVVPRCELVLTSHEREKEWWKSDSHDGRFEFANQAQGRFVVSAQSKDGRQAHRRVDLREGEVADGIELVLERGAQLMLRHTAAKMGCGYRVFVDHELFVAGSLTPWEVRTCTVPAGELEVRWSISALRFEETQTLTLAAGELGELVFKGKP